MAAKSAKSKPGGKAAARLDKAIARAEATISKRRRQLDEAMSELKALHAQRPVAAPAAGREVAARPVESDGKAPAEQTTTPPPAPAATKRTGSARATPARATPGRATSGRSASGRSSSRRSTSRRASTSRPATRRRKAGPAT
jgi:hypothetical protein